MKTHLMLLLLWPFLGIATAQRPAPPTQDEKSPATQNERNPERAAPQRRNRSSSRVKEELRPRGVKLTTKDGVQLLCGYFPSDREKDAVPVIIVHEWNGQGRTYTPLALKLQAAGCAVAIPDLRGHGGSQMIRDPRTGEDTPIDREKLGKAGVAATLFDLETVKKFLEEENNAGKLNLNALVVIGVQEGAIIGYNWAAGDWNYQTLPGLKQGQDVKACVMVSPERLIEGVTYMQALRTPYVPRLPTLIVAGAESEQAREAQRVEKLLSRLRQGNQPAWAFGGEVAFVQPPTALSGAQLVNNVNGISDSIVGFIQANVIAKQDRFEWIER